MDRFAVLFALLCGIVGFGLFMTLFDSILETNMSVAAPTSSTCAHDMFHLQKFQFIGIRKNDKDR